MDYGKGDEMFLSCYNSHIRSEIYFCMLKTKRMNIYVRARWAGHRGADRGLQVDARKPPGNFDIQYFVKINDKNSTKTKLISYSF
jgi:hypothetical protein